MLRFPRGGLVVFPFFPNWTSSESTINSLRFLTFKIPHHVAIFKATFSTAWLFFCAAFDPHGHEAPYFFDPHGHGEHKKTVAEPIIGSATVSCGLTLSFPFFKTF
jgi:hypothetical protein